MKPIFFRRILLTSAVFIIFLASGCGVIPRTPSGETLSFVGDGVASWYGPNFHGKKTANGETFKMDELTAAHRTLPFNTRVRIDNTDNGRSVIVRINDRGPYVGNRVIDLSREAASKLGMIQTGTANVQIYLIQEGDRPLTNQNISNRESYTIQLASFETEEDAEIKSSSVIGSRVERVQVSNQIFYRVYYGLYYDTEEARIAQQQLSNEGINGFVKQAEN